METLSQSTIKMDKGYYSNFVLRTYQYNNVAIHNKNGQGLLLSIIGALVVMLSQSTIKMDKGYYLII